SVHEFPTLDFNYRQGTACGALRAFAIVTKNVAKAPSRDFRSAARPALSDLHIDARLSRRTCGSVALSRSRPAGVRLAWRDDGADRRGHLGGASLSRGVDTGSGAAHHHHVGPGGDAYALPEAAAGAQAAAALLRGQRLAAAAGAHPSRLQLSVAEENDLSAAPPDRPAARPAGSGTDGAFATAAPFGCARASRGGKAAGRSRRQPHTRTVVQGLRRRQAHGGADLSRGGNELRPMAPATPPDARGAPAGRRRQGDARGDRGRL